MCFSPIAIYYRIYHIDSDRQAWANSVDPDENAACLQDLHSLPLIEHILDTASGSKLYLFKSLNKYGGELKCPNT